MVRGGVRRAVGGGCGGGGDVFFFIVAYHRFCYDMFTMSHWWPSIKTSNDFVMFLV